MAFQPPPNLCPVCKEGTTFFFRKDHKNQDGNFSLYECQSCTVQFWLPLKNPGAKWHGAREGYRTSELLRPVVKRAYHKRFLSRWGNALEGKRVLDIGCGAGEFLAELQKKGADVWGVEPQKLAIAAAKRHFQLTHLFAMSFDEFMSAASPPLFDYVCCFETLQYVDNPREFVQHMQKILKPGGMVVLSVPSRTRLLADWNGWDFPPNHLTKWHRDAIKKISELSRLYVKNVYYGEDFSLLLDAINRRVRFGMVSRVQRMNVKESTSVFLTFFLIWLGKLKEFLIGVIPAAFLWTWGKIRGVKNGTMVVELQTTIFR